MMSQVHSTDNVQVHREDVAQEDAGNNVLHENMSRNPSTLVGTKVEDGGSHKSSVDIASDTFAQYSDQNHRMMHLLGLGHQDNRKVVEEGSDTERKTRLSFELHISLFMEQWSDDEIEE